VIPNVRDLWRRAAPYALLAAVTAAAVASGLTQRVDHLLYDGLIAFDRPPVHDDLVIVAIDEPSLAQLGRWPWPRATHARLLERLREARVRAVALQIIFAEPSVPQADRALAEAVAGLGRVVLPVFPEVVEGAAFGSAGAGAGLVPLHASRPLPELAAGARLGHVDTELDEDGLARAVYLKAGMEGELEAEGHAGTPWSHISLALVEAGGVLDRTGAVRGLRGEARAATANGRRVESTAGTAGTPARWVRDLRALVPFAAAPFPTLSYVDVLERPEVAARLRGKLVLVGVTAPGFGDALAVPMSRAGAPMAGVEFNAHAANALLQGRLVLPLPVLPTLLLALALPWGALWAAQNTPRRRAGWIAPVTALGLLALAAALLRWADLWLSPAGALLGVLLSYPVWAWRTSQRDAQALAAEKTRLDATLQSIGDAVLATDLHSRVSYMNPAAEALLGTTLAAAQGRSLEDIVSFEDDHGKTRHPAREVLVPPSQPDFAAGVHGRLTVRPGYTRVARISGRPVCAAGAADASGVVLAFTDLTDLAEMTARIEHQATHDALTDLPNRALLRDRLTQALARARRAPADAARVAVLFIDLDHFKRVNDSLGHGEGDLVLREVAQRLRAAVRAADTVARWGGDEFVVLLDGLSSRTAAEDRARALIEALRVPAAVRNGVDGVGGVGGVGGVDGVDSVRASIGVALFPADGDDADTLLRRADAAMYDAKAAGRDALAFYRTQQHETAAERTHLERDLRAALSRQQLLFHYQPQVRLETGAIVGVQALLRWRHPTAGVLPPHHFMDLAEAAGLMHDIAVWSLHEACRVLRTWRAGGLPPVTMAVNVSVRQLTHPKFEAAVIGAMDREGIGEDVLQLEITEGVMSAEMERAAAVLTRLRARGVAAVIDDFGVGYSSLRYLKRFPVAALKIDPSFVTQAAVVPQDAAIVDALVSLSRGLRLELVAEGIETEAQRDFLRQRGCALGQGNFFCGPLPLVETTRLIAARDPLPLG
jgi:diguanylate cyclase (GGDEF)-like protein/PAS domain S-box-containing protein